MATIKLKNGSGAPLASDLVQGEPALDLTNKRLYTEDSLGAVIEVGVNPTELNVTNDITVGGTVDGRDIATDGAKLDGIEAGADVTDTTNVTAAGAVMDSELTSEASVKALDQGVATTDSPTFAGLTTTGNVTFGDNDKATFGAGSDLAVYHNGSNGFVENETGLLILKNNSDDRDVAIQSDDGSGGIANYLVADGSTGALNAYHYGSLKLATTSTGVDVTGTVTADGLTVATTQGNITIPTSTSSLNFDRAGSNYIRATDATGSFTFITGASDFTTQRLKLLSNGDVAFYEDTGTTEKLLWDASQERLEIDSVNANVLRLERNGGTDANVSIEFNCATNDWYVGTNPANNFAIGTSLDQTNAPFQIDSSGNVTIGQTSASDKTLSIGSAGATHFDVTTAGATGIVTLNATNDSTAGKINLQTADTDRLLISNNGDISFYEDTGTTAQFFWDASGEVLGIGTSAPSSTYGLDVRKNIRISNAAPQIELSESDASNQRWAMFGLGGDLTFRDITNNVYAMTLQASTGNVGIGTSSPAKTLHISAGVDASPTTFRIENTDTTIDTGQEANAIEFYTNDASTNGTGVSSKIAQVADNPGSQYDLVFSTYNTALAEAMRITNEGNVLVGGTSTTPWSNGTGTASDNQLVAREDGILGASTYKATASSGYVGYFNRTSTDGGILAFNKDGATVGSIGANGGDLYIGTGDTTLLFSNSADAVVPRGTDGATRDAAIGLGNSSNRFKDLYLSGGAYLGGTAAANKLDDYEEGTWTPTLTGTTSGSATVTVTSANYTKVGNVVHVYAEISADLSTHNIVGAVEVGGLPFSVSPANNGGGSASYNAFVSGSVFLRAQATQLRLSKGTSAGWQHTDLASTSSALFIFNATYKT